MKLSFRQYNALMDTWDRLWEPAEKGEPQVLTRYGWVLLLAPVDPVVEHERKQAAADEATLALRSRELGQQIAQVPKILPRRNPGTHWVEPFADGEAAF